MSVEVRLAGCASAELLNKHTTGESTFPSNETNPLTVSCEVDRTMYPARYDVWENPVDEMRSKPARTGAMIANFDEIEFFKGLGGLLDWQDTKVAAESTHMHHLESTHMHHLINIALVDAAAYTEKVVSERVSDCLHDVKPAGTRSTRATETGSQKSET